VKVPQEPLFRLKALRATVKNATAYVDKDGLHVRWIRNLAQELGWKPAGGLNLVAPPSAKGWTAVVNLPARPEVAEIGAVAA